MNTTPKVWNSPAFLKRNSLPYSTYFDTQYDPFHYEDNLESGRNKKLKLGPKSYGWRTAEPKSSLQSEAGPILQGNSNNLSPDYVEGTKATRLSPPGQGDVFLEKAPPENITHHSTSDRFSDSVQVVDQNDDLLNEDAWKPLHQRHGADIQSGEDGQTLGLEDPAYERAKGNSPQASELHGKIFHPISVIDKEGKLDTAQRNEAHIQNEQEFVPKPTPDVAAAGRERAKDICMTASRGLGVSTPEKQVHSSESPVSTACSNIISQDALLEGKDKSCTDAELSIDVSDGPSIATGLGSIHENQRNIFPEAENVESGSGVTGDVTAASSILSNSQDLNNEYQDQLDLTPDNAAAILGSDSQQFEMSPILSSSSPGKDAPDILAEDLLSDGSSSFTDENVQYDRSGSIALHDIRNEVQLDSTTFLHPIQERPEGALSSIVNGSSRSNSEDRPCREAIVSVEGQNTELIGIAAEGKLSPGTETIHVEEPSPEKTTDESLMLTAPSEKEIATKPEVDSSMEYKVDPSPTASASVRSRIYDRAWPKTETLASLRPSSAELQRDFGLNNRQMHSLQTKEGYQKEYRSNPTNNDISFTLNDNYENSDSTATTIGPTQRSSDESLRKVTKPEDEISSRQEIASARRDTKKHFVTLPTKPDIEVIDLESENENEYYGVPASQLAKDAASTPIEIENTGDGPFQDDQIAKAGDTQSILRHIPRPVNRTEGADEAVGIDVMVPTINNNNQKVDHGDRQMEQSSITLSNPAESGQNPAVELSIAKGELSLHESDSDLGGFPRSFISALDEQIPKNSTNLTYDTQLFTPAASQPQTGFELDPSAAIVQAPDNELLTPSMTQTSTAPLLRPNAPQEKPTPSSSEQSSLISEESISRIAQEHNFETLSSPSTKISTMPPLRPSTPDQKHLVVDKLKAIRSRPIKRALARKAMDRQSSASPWFTHKEPSQFTHVSDSEGELESVYSSDQISPIQEGSLPPAPIQNHKMSEPSLSGLRTALSYYAPLATLLSHFNNLTSVLATVHSFTPIKRSISGPRDYHQSLYLTDPSSVSCPLTLAQIFRPYETAFPNAIQGDAILLRNFKVQSFQNKVGLLSTNSSAWAVFRQDTEVQVRGPPVEFGPEERSFARGLRNWWGSMKSEHGKREILQMPIVFIEGREEEARKSFKDNRKSNLHIVPKGIASTRNPNKTHARKPNVSPSPKPPAKDGRAAQETPTRNRTRSTSTQGTNSSPASDRHTLRDGIWHEPSPGPEVPAPGIGHTPTRTPPKRRRNVAATQGFQSSPSSDRHVLRDGTSYGSTPEKMVRRPGVNYHELRDGTTYVDDEGVGDRA